MFIRIQLSDLFELVANELQSINETYVGFYFLIEIRMLTYDLPMYTYDYL